MDSSSIFSQAIIHSNVGFCVLNLDGTIQLTNEAFNTITQGTNVLGANMDSVIRSSDEDFITMLKTVREDKICSREVEFICHEIPFFAQANASLVKDNGKELLAIFFTEVNVHKDLAVKLEGKIAVEIEKNRQKDQMMHQQAKLATMGEMIGNIAHQWRQPLNIMALVLQDIYIKFKLGALDEGTLEKNYDKANNLLQYMSQTIDDFRSFFKNEVENEPFEVLRAIHAINDLVGSRFSTNKTTCKIKQREDITVIGSQNGFKQVVINILNNAQEAIILTKKEQGVITIDVKEVEDYAVVVIQDNGGGIPETILDQVFEPYFTTKHQTQGTGLGLYMSKQIIEKTINGKLEVKNSKEGAEFSIWLPRKK